MSKYLRKFETSAAYTAAESTLVKPNVSYIVETNGVEFNPYVPQPITYTASAKLDKTWSDETAKFGATIKSHTFENGVGTIEFDGDVTSIGEYAFSSCRGLTSITIPDSVTSIGVRTFIGCSGLTSVTIGSGVTSIGEFAFQGCTGLTSITIPDSVTSIGDSAFTACSGLTSITIPDSVTTIGHGAFQGCTGLTSITIGSGVTSIGMSAFSGCSGLTSIAIPSGVTTIGGYAFSGCSNLSTITSHIMNAPSVDGGTFYQVNNGGTLYVPIGSSGYETWMNDQGNLGYHNWTKVEQ